MKQMCALLLFSAIAVFGSMTAVAEETELTTENAEKSGTWMDYQITIEGDVYTFPMMCDDFIAYGWGFDEAEEVLEPYTYNVYQFSREDSACSVYLLNLGINSAAAKECIVAGISIDRQYWDDIDSVVELPGGIVNGISTGEDIIAAYGTPTDIYEGSAYTQYIYQEDYNREVELTVYLDGGVLREIQIENFIEPEDFDPGESSTDIPQSVLAYAKPDALSADITEYEIELDGEVYSLPVPVSVLLDDGWELVGDKSDAQVAAHYYGQVTLRKNSQSFASSVVNSEDYATIPDNCWLELLSVGGYILDMDGALPGGVSIGITEEEFLSILEENGMDYEYSESGDYHYYTYNSPEYGSGCEAVIYAGLDSFFEKDTVIEVVCENSLE